MTAETPDLSISRVFDAPRALVYRAFTDPEQVAAWWGPTGSVRPLDEMEFDVRPGGYQRFVEVFPDDPSIRAEVHIDLADVAEGRVLDGVMRVRGRLPGGFGAFETRFRFEFYDEPDGRTRLEVRQWLPAHVSGATEEGWRQSFAELDAHLATMAVSLIRPLGPHLYGSQLYEPMAPWETSPELAAQSDLTAESACTWAAATKGTSR